ncbi:MAG: two-component system sensor histidine kinase NtrB [Terriglobales bacterium]|jgi:PAS domain S-box-containing protein
MAGRIRLKTQLVIAITAMMVAVVAAFATVFLSQLIQHRIADADDGAHFVANQVFNATRQALELDLTSTKVDTSNEGALKAAIEESLQTDPGLNSLLQSIVGYSPTIYDVSLVGLDGRALLHTDPQDIGKIIPQRENFADVRNGSLRQQLGIVYGPASVYEIRVPVERDNKPFAQIRVGISTVFLKSELRPQLDHALTASGIAILVSLLLAAGLSNWALRPLTTIGKKLDLMTIGDAHEHEPESAATDEVGVVTTKIDRLGRQMRDVKDVFSALKENVDQIMANLQDGLVLFTHDSRVVLVSAAVERFLGRPRGEMLGKNAAEIFADGSEIGNALLDAFGQHHGLMQQEFQNAVGERIIASLDFIEEDSEQIGALMVLRDAESVRRIENEIEISHRLAAAGRLVSGVGHEVKNPINAIVVHLEVLRQKLRDIDPDARRHMDVIGSEIQRLDRVVQMLIDFTRPVELRLGDVDLRKLGEDVALLASPEAARQGVIVRREWGTEPLFARIDADLFKQALLNVVLNGVQAMPKGGDLWMSASRIGNEVELTVRDQGAGIAPDIRDKIYNLYFTTKKSGSGIGLAMAFKVVQLMNGSMDFDSIVGTGTSFHIRVPLLGSGREAQTPPPFAAMREIGVQAEIGKK